ncbi:MAG: hypothetical protein ACREDC_11365 [Bradyrhizobium sp.]
MAKASAPSTTNRLVRAAEICAAFIALFLTMAGVTVLSEGDWGGGIPFGAALAIVELLRLLDPKGCS